MNHAVRLACAVGHQPVKAFRQHQHWIIDGRFQTGEDRPIVRSAGK
jgi:hypothetical protein